MRSQAATWSHWSCSTLPAILPEFALIEDSLRGLAWVELDAADWTRAREVYRVLGGRPGMMQRSVKHPDLLIAERCQLVPLRLLQSEVSSIRFGRSIGRIAQTRQAAPTAGRCDCLGATLCLPEAEGPGLLLRIVDVPVVGRSRAPTLRRSRASGAAQTEPVQTPQDPAAGRIATAQIRYYVEKRDPDFETKMASVLHVYKEVEIVNEYRRGEAGRQLGMVTISYDEKPGIQALATTTPDRPPVVGTHPSHLRDYEYVRLGTVSLLAGLDLHSGRVIETVSDTHTSGDFIAFLKKLDRAYPEHHQIRLVLDNHSAHISKETRGYLQTMPQRFVFVFTPTHGSWLNLIENQFSKMTRTMLRGIRVASKQELIDRIHQYFEEINAAPVVFRWKYKMDETIIV